MTQATAKQDTATVRFVLEDDVSADDVASSVRIAMEAEGLDVAAPIDEIERPGYRHRTWEIGSGQGYIKLVDDDMMATRWLGLCAPLPLLAKIQATLAAHIGWVLPQDLVSEARKGGARNIIRMAIGTNALWDEDVAHVLAGATEASDPDSRAAAAEAMYLLRWRGLLPLVQRALAAEQDPGIAAMLREVASRFMQ